MRYDIRIVGPIPPATAIAPALSLDDAKAHLNVDFDADDALIEAYVAAAQDAVERHTSQVLTPRLIELAAWGFPLGCATNRDCAFELPREPVTGVNEIAYTDAGGAEVDLEETAWRWSESAPRLVRPAWATSWPAAADEAGSVRIEFEAGYEEGLCPASLVEAVKRQTAFLYGDRGDVGGEDGLAPGVVALCRPFRRVCL